MTETKTTNPSVGNGKGSELVIERIFDAPRELLWQAWSDPDYLMRWWGPKDFSAPICKVAFRPGGKYLFCMRSLDGQDFWSTGTYKEIVPLERIVCTDSFADADGNVVPATDYGMEPNFPAELLVDLTFENLGGRTKLTLRHIGIPDGLVSEMTGQSWNQSFDKLVEVLR